MKNNFAKTFLFSFPIYKIRIDPNSYDKEKIINDIIYNKSLKNTRNDIHQTIGSSISDIHHSYMDFDNEEFIPINYDKLKDVYLETYDEFFNKILYMVSTAVRTTYRYSFKIVNYSAMTEGQHLSQHNHTGCDFSTIHYLNFKNDHVLTCFSNPSSYSLFLRKLQPDLSNILQANKDHSYFQDSHHFPVEEDDMVIFPASLIHEVWPQGPTKEPRVTISSNIRIRYGE